MDSERWNRMCVSEQILNIGGEVQRAVDRKARNENESAGKYLEKALEWLALSKADPKNVNRIRELDLVEEELNDYFHENRYQNDRFSIMTYWDSFLTAIY